MEPPAPDPTLDPIEPDTSPNYDTSTKADLVKRFVALLIDGVIGMILGLIPFIGALLGGAYILVRDGMEFDFMDQRSIGKKVMKLRPIKLDGSPMDLNTSIMRNLPLCIGSIGSAITAIVGSLSIALMLAGLFSIIALVVVLVEVVLVLTDDQGRRFGDKYAGTMVVEVSE